MTAKSLCHPFALLSLLCPLLFSFGLELRASPTDMRQETRETLVGPFTATALNLSAICRSESVV
jgi:hypothetical protein